MTNPYAPSAIDDDGRFVVSIPHMEGRITVSPPGLFAGNKLYVDGEVAPRGSKWGTYALPDGRDAQLAAGMTRTVPTVIVDGERFELGQAIPMPLVILQFLPFVLIGIGGCLGGAAGGAGVATNMTINRQDWPVAMKVGAMLGVTVVSVVMWLTIATAFAVLLS